MDYELCIEYYYKSRHVVSNLPFYTNIRAIVNQKYQYVNRDSGYKEIDGYIKKYLSKMGRLIAWRNEMEQEIRKATHIEIIKGFIERVKC